MELFACSQCPLPTEDFSLQQSICFIRMLVTVITVRAGEHYYTVHTYIHAYVYMYIHCCTGGHVTFV